MSSWKIFETWPESTETERKRLLRRLKPQVRLFYGLLLRCLSFAIVRNLGYLSCCEWLSGLCILSTGTNCLQDDVHGAGFLLEPLRDANASTESSLPSSSSCEDPEPGLFDSYCKDAPDHTPPNTDLGGVHPGSSTGHESTRCTCRQYQYLPDYGVASSQPHKPKCQLLCLRPNALHSWRRLTSDGPTCLWLWHLPSHAYSLVSVLFSPWLYPHLQNETT